MAVTQAQIDAVVAEIVALSAGNFSDGELSVDNRAKLETLEKKLKIMKAEFYGSSTLTCGAGKIAGVDE